MQRKKKKRTEEALQKKEAVSGSGDNVIKDKFTITFTEFDYPDKPLGLEIAMDSYGNVMVQERGTKLSPIIRNGLFIVKMGENDTEHGGCLSFL